MSPSVRSGDIINWEYFVDFEWLKKFEINHVNTGSCFQAAQDGIIDSDVSF